MNLKGQVEVRACLLAPLQVLVLLADSAALHIFTYGKVHARPLIHALHVMNCSMIANVTCINGVVQLT